MSLADQVAEAAPDAVVERGEQKNKPLIIANAEGLRGLLESARRLGFDHLSFVTAVDWPQEKLGDEEWLPDFAHESEEGLMELVYMLYSYEANEHLAVQCWVPREVGACKVPSVADIWATADWHERETYDLYGVRFEGHPALRRIFLPEEWAGHPGRKDYDLSESQFIYRDDEGEDHVTFDPGKGW